MGHKPRNRPIVGTTPAGVGAKYIVVEQDADDYTIQVIANGTVTFTVDWTVQNILYDAAAIQAVNIRPQVAEADRYVDPASAVWNNLIATGSANANADLDFPVFAFRINITAGTGSVTYTIMQA